MYLFSSLQKGLFPRGNVSKSFVTPAAHWDCSLCLALRSSGQHSAPRSPSLFTTLVCTRCPWQIAAFSTLCALFFFTWASRAVHVVSTVAGAEGELGRLSETSTEDNLLRRNLLEPIRMLLLPGSLTSKEQSACPVSLSYGVSL